jgi:PAS domain S-box-containing protein
VKRWESFLWRSPQWVTYALAVGTAVLTLLARAYYQPVFGDKLALVFSTIPVAIAALIGGLWPGLVAAAIGLLGGMLFLGPGISIEDSTKQIEMSAFAGIWTFISIVCDSLRRMARSFADNARVQEVQRIRLETILNSITDGFFAVDRDWTVTHTNPPFRAMMNKTERELVGKDLWDILSGPNNFEVRVRISDAKRSGNPLAIDVPRDNGGWFQLRAFPNADGMFVYVQDISARKALEAQRDQLLADERAARHDAEIASRLKDDFVANLSHELRTPLTTMLGWTEILQHRHIDKPDVTEALQAIERSARHQAQLIEDLLDMSRAMTGKLKLDLGFVSLGDLAYEVAESLIPTAEARGILLKVRPSDDPDIVRGDAKRLFQVVANLVSNAIKFTQPGGRVDLEIESRESQVCVMVRDTGEGIDPEFLPFLFDRFRQADASASRRHGGLGLGLAIAKQLAELHGGTVSAFSEGLGKGSTFEVCLPVTRMRPREETRRYDGSLPKDLLAGLSVLVVDDDPQTLEVLSAGLGEYGASVIKAASAHEALEELAEIPVDVLLSDIGMPDMDGYELIRQVRCQDNGVPAIAFTAFATEADREKALQAGFQRHLAKPIDLHRLLMNVAQIAGREVTTPS